MSDKQLGKLIKKRGSMKGRLTIFSKYIDNVKNMTNLSHSDVIQLETRLIKAESLISEFSVVQDAIEEVAENLEEQIVERGKFEDDFYNVTAIAKDIVECSSRQPASTSTVDEVDNNAPSGGTNKGNSNVNFKSVRLPTIELCKFNGSYEKWLEFRDTFESLIHQNQSLAPIQKFHYLRASLEGTAAEVIKSVEFTAETYSVAWETLCQRFDNKKLLIYNHVRALFSLDTAYKESSKGIRKLVDDLSKNLKSLEQLGQNVGNWDTLIIFMITSKLDNITLREWEKYSSSSNSLPQLDDLKEFLKGRADLLETLEYKYSNKPQKDTKHVPKVLVSSGYSCSFCQREHSIYFCKDFLQLSIQDRVAFVKQAKLCLNCLRKGHSATKCTLGNCKWCKCKHNSLLHQGNRNHTNIPVVKAKEITDETTNNISAVTSSSTGHVFLSTAYVDITGKNGKTQRARVLLDCASQSSFCTSHLCELLGVDKQKCNLSIQGISGITSNVRYKCKLEIRSLTSKFTAPVTCFVLPEVTGYIPSCRVDISTFSIPKHIHLADPGFYKPGPIDILLGADLFWSLLCSQRIPCGRNQPIIQQTKLGWVVSGGMGISKMHTMCNLSATQELNKLLSKFWEIEECGSIKPLSKDELACEAIFEQTTRRDLEGRFIVTLPLKQPANSLGESRSLAEKRFYSLERKLSKNDVLCQRYTEFLMEYESLNHMTLVKVNNTSQAEVEYFMPHHGVLREESLTTKLRVVFDASAPTSNGLSLNNIQLVGPVLQDDLLSIILRFRKHTFVMSADIAKMYRQVLVEPSQRYLQKILWRSSPTESLREYELNTVTYGQASGSFLAIRCLHELGNECKEASSEVAYIIQHDFYVDDLLTGANTIAQAQSICQNVSKVLLGGCFELRKWRSNNALVLETLGNKGTSDAVLEFAPNETAKILGLNWSCEDDHLIYKIDDNIAGINDTKRNVLSLTAKIFDPLGLLSCCTIVPKIIMQKLWTEKLSWDEALPEHLNATWHAFKDQLPILNKVTVPRHAIHDNSTSVELHGFADASETAFGGCIYLRSINHEGDVLVELLCAKSKVAPIKTISIPKLELCAALLLARLANKVIKSIGIEFERCSFWSDSTITLAWINTSPNLLKTFIGNRVSEIQTLTQPECWRYTPTKSNPADYISRGLLPKQILDLHSWWHGPLWLQQDPYYWPNDKPPKVECLPEMKSKVSILIANVNTYQFPFQQFSKYSRLLRATAYILRFKNNCLQPKAGQTRGPLSTVDLRSAALCLAKSSQRQSFPEEYLSLSSGKTVSSKSKISSLNPFLDKEELIRVGGRLHASSFGFEKKHPIVLDSRHHFTKLLFEYEHNRLLHAGPQLLLSSVREQFWPISGRNLARATVRKCLRCFRFNPKIIQPIMGNLPADRVKPASPFSTTGVDYAGPFLSKDKQGRGSKLQKCYVGLFICFATKAVHLELISSLSTDSFLQALRRFVSRRGKPFQIFSDNGTNFVGAKRELTHFLKSNGADLTSKCAADQIHWEFIPPYSPHIGGLWEAGVKSFKHHLKRVLDNKHLLFEEFVTILTQIEAILNSRPLCPMSSDPNDLNPLTPAHFLIGRPLVAVPDADLQDIQTNRLTRFELLQQVYQHFWKRWSTEYISELQQRYKWKQNQGELLEGSMVLIKDGNSHPTNWKLGRITKLHRGADGIARVASINTSSGEVQRSYTRICPLPIEF